MVLRTAKKEADHLGCNCCDLGLPGGGSVGVDDARDATFKPTMTRSVLPNALRWKELTPGLQWMTAHDSASALKFQCLYSGQPSTPWLCDP